MDIVRAWKDPQYRATLDAAGVDMLAHPAGVPGLERLNSAELDAMAGAGTEQGATIGCCNWYMTITMTTGLGTWCTTWTICY